MLTRLLLLPLLVLALPAAAADRTTHHTIQRPAGPFELDAAVETFRLVNSEGKPSAEIVTTAFLHDAKDRPVTFAFNGGPGASSAWLDLGAIGPWRVPLAIPVVPSQDPTPVNNPDTWLDFTDLVFIDPPGTGYSRAIGDAKPFYTVQGDVAALATTIHRWLEAHHRLASPVYLVGESYGGFRGPLVARALLQQQGIGVRGLILVSPVLDFAGRDGPYDPMRWVATLPSMAAAHRHAPGRDAVADVEAWAAGPYLLDLVRGPNDAAAQSRIATGVSAYTGVPEAAVRRLEGRLDWASVLRDQSPGQVASPYDITLRAADPFPGNRRDNSPDPVLDGLRGPVTAAMLLLYARLDWHPDNEPRHYELLNDALNRQWDYGRGGRPEAMTALRQYVSLDATARVLVVHGLYDIVTPYFASALLLDQVPATTPPGRVTLQAFPGGHMFYTGDASRHALHDAARALVAADP